MKVQKIRISVIQFILLVYIYCGQTVNSQNGESDGFLYPIEINDSVFTGLGMDWILDNARESQYLLLGEQHGVEQLGDFSRFTLSQLSHSGYNRLGLEMDSWTINRIEESGLTRFISKYPHSVAFGYDGELRMIQDALDQGVNLAGLDQMVTAIHPFQRLIELSETPARKRLSRGLFLKASLKMGEYLREEHFRDLDVLSDVFENHRSDEVKQILNELRVSMEIYTKWRSGQRGEISRKISPELRENMMKQNFDAWIADDESYRLNKIVLKMAGAHLMYGIGPNGIPTLGEHIREKAALKGQKVFAVGIRNFDSETSLVTEDDFGNAEMVVVDTRKIRDIHPRDSIMLQNKDYNQLSVNGFDAIVYFRNAGWAKQTILSRYKQQFKSQLINQVIPLGILLLLSIIAVFVFVIQLFKQMQKGLKIPVWVAFFTSLLLSGMVIYQLLSILNIISRTATIMNPGASVWIFAACVVLSVFCIVLAIRNFKLKQFSNIFKIYYLIMAIVFIVMSGYCYYWNVGGMLINYG